MKRAASPTSDKPRPADSIPAWDSGGASNTTAATNPAKRPKASKACLGCRHQKTRCEPGIGLPDGAKRCKRCCSWDNSSSAGYRDSNGDFRCNHFNLTCSLEGEEAGEAGAIPSLSRSQIPTVLPSIRDSLLSSSTSSTRRKSKQGEPPTNSTGIDASSSSEHLPPIISASPEVADRPTYHPTPPLQLDQPNDEHYPSPMGYSGSSRPPQQHHHHKQHHPQQQDAPSYTRRPHERSSEHPSPPAHIPRPPSSSSHQHQHQHQQQNHHSGPMGYSNGWSPNYRSASAGSNYGSGNLVPPQAPQFLPPSSHSSASQSPYSHHPSQGMPPSQLSRPTTGQPGDSGDQHESERLIGQYPVAPVSPPFRLSREILEKDSALAACAAKDENGNDSASAPAISVCMGGQLRVGLSTENPSIAFISKVVTVPPKMDAGGGWIRPSSFVRDLITPNSPIGVEVPPSNMISRGLLSSSDADILSNIWNQRYGPWLTNETPETLQDHRAASSFLQAVRWSLAVQHLPATFEPSTESTTLNLLRTRLERTLQHGLLQAMLGIDASLDAIRALNILGMWSSRLSLMSVSRSAPLPDNLTITSANSETEGFGHKNSTVYDGEMFFAVAVRAACGMHLEIDVQRLVYAASQLKNPSPGYKPMPIEALAIAKDRARMMFSVSVMDAFASIGKGRPFSPRVPYHHVQIIFGTPASLAAHNGGGALARLVFQCNLLDIVLRGLSMCHPNGMRAFGFHGWRNKIQSEFQNLDEWYQLLAPVIALTDPKESIQMSIVTMQGYFCKHNMLFSAFRVLRMVYPDMRPLKDFTHARSLFDRSHGWSASHSSESEQDQVSDQAADWVHISLNYAERMMIECLSLRVSGSSNNQPIVPGEPVGTPFSYAPDPIAFMVFFGPIFIIKGHFMSLGLRGQAHPRAETTRSLLDRMLDFLREASEQPPGSEFSFNRASTSDPETSPSKSSMSIPGRCAELLSVLLKVWDSRTKEIPQRDAAETLAGISARPQSSQKSGPSSAPSLNWTTGFATSKTRGNGADDEQDELMSDGEVANHSNLQRNGGSNSSGQRLPTSSTPQPFYADGAPHHIDSSTRASDQVSNTDALDLDLLGSTFNFDLAQFNQSFFNDTGIMFDVPPEVYQNLSYQSSAYPVA